MVDADGAARSLLAPLSEDQRLLVDTILEVFNRSAAWPTFQYVEHVLAAATPAVDARAVLESLPRIGSVDMPGLSYGAVWTDTAGGAIQPGAETGLSLVGLHHAGSPNVPLGISIIRLLASHYRSWRPDPFSAEYPSMKWSDFVASGVELPRWVTLDGNDRFVRAILAREPPTVGISGSDEAWAIPLSSRLRGFETGTSIESYVDAIRAYIAPDRPMPPEPAAFGARGDSAPTADDVPVSLRVFVSYRRADLPYVAGRLRDQLAAKFGHVNVFFDVDSIDAGKDFRSVINDALVLADVVLALIGPGWNPARLADDGDYVRRELAAALDLGKPVIPVLLAGGDVPRADELPPDLEAIAFLNATQLRSDPDFDPDYRRLVSRLEHQQDELATTRLAATRARTMVFVDGDWYDADPELERSIIQRWARLADALQRTFDPVPPTTAYLAGGKDNAARVAVASRYFRVIVGDRGPKTTDTRMAVDVVASSVDADRVVLVTGDSDFVPVIEHLRASNRLAILVTVASRCSAVLTAVATETIDLEVLLSTQSPAN